MSGVTLDNEGSQTAADDGPNSATKTSRESFVKRAFEKMGEVQQSDKSDS